MRHMTAMVSRSLWERRNESVWNQKGMEVVDVVESAKVVLNQGQCAQDKLFDNYLGFMKPCRW